MATDSHEMAQLRLQLEEARAEVVYEKTMRISLEELIQPMSINRGALLHRLDQTQQLLKCSLDTKPKNEGHSEGSSCQEFVQLRGRIASLECALAQTQQRENMFRRQMEQLQQEKEAPRRAIRELSCMFDMSPAPAPEDELHRLIRELSLLLQSTEEELKLIKVRNVEEEVRSLVTTTIQLQDALEKVHVNETVKALTTQLQDSRDETILARKETESARQDTIQAQKDCEISRGRILELQAKVTLLDSTVKKVEEMEKGNRREIKALQVKLVETANDDLISHPPLASITTHSSGASQSTECTSPPSVRQEVERLTEQVARHRERIALLREGRKGLGSTSSDEVERFSEHVSRNRDRIASLRARRLGQLSPSTPRKIPQPSSPRSIASTSSCRSTDSPQLSLDKFTELNHFWDQKCAMNKDS
jgi:hypothetical protein